MNSIVVDHISKTYRKQQIIAIDDISLDIHFGEIFGLIGPDGAGKTTLFRLLTTLLLPDKGSASVLGFDVVKDYLKIRPLLGYMPGRFSLYPDLTVEENLHFFATLFQTTVAENYALIEEIYGQLEPFKHRRAGKLSGGMKQKLALCCALIHKPRILFLDEPTTGVDPVSRKEFWQVLQQLKNQDITIVVSTPYMDEALLCDRIALIQKGHLLSVDAPTDIQAAYPYDLFALRPNRMSDALRRLKNLHQKQSAFAFGEYIHIAFSKNTMEPEALQTDLKALGLSTDIQRIPPSIEDCFIQLLHP